MSNNLKFELNDNGVRELLTGDAMKAIINKSANTVKNNAGGDGYGIEVKRGEKRIYSYVFADTPKTKRDNMKNNTLLKALHK